MAEIRCTYRLQLTPEFGFASASAITPYLAALGVSHAFSSPCLLAAPGSRHGYDVAAHDCLSVELGGEDGFLAWQNTLRQCGLGLVLDVAPNHMSIATARNRWWWDVLQLGPASPYASYFDLRWREPDAPEDAPEEKILLPWLTRPYHAALIEGDIALAQDTKGQVVVHFGSRSLPLKPHSLREPISEQDLDRINALPERLDALLQRQHYRLAHWSVADHELPYRRFFDVSDLIGVRMDRPEVFAASHQRVLTWLASGDLDGLRIDHLDGLRDPRAYLNALHGAAPAAWIVAEKILAADEELPPDWPIAGTTGYDFLNRVIRLFVDPAGEQALTACFEAVAGPQPRFTEVALQARQQVLQDLLHSELRWLSGLLYALRDNHDALREKGRIELEQLVSTLARHFSVYRTYVVDCASPADAAAIEAAVSAAVAEEPGRAQQHRALGALLRGGDPNEVELERDFRLRFQQFTPALYAKGVEDTAFYRSFRLCALNEVGSDPDWFALSPADFHRAQERVQQRWPATMLTTTTHDTKRGEDVRARLVLLSEMPARWQETVLSWQRHLAPLRPGELEANIEYLFFQTLVGAWPVNEERMQAYLLKAVREAKLRTSWRHGDETYEKHLREFVAACYRDAGWMREVASFVAPLVTPGRINSLAQTLLKLTSPGVPDLYNGAELWDLSLVDPDNRRPVNFSERRQLLDELRRDPPPPDRIWSRADEGLPKLWLIYQALRLRSERPRAFSAAGVYQPLYAHGAGAEHLVAFARGGEVVTVVPRLRLQQPPWGDTRLDLPPARWRNRLTGELVRGGSVKLEALLTRFPVALLAREGEP